MEFSTPQPIDECLAILGESMVRDKEVTAVISVYAKAVKDGEVQSMMPLSLPDCILPLQDHCHSCASTRQREPSAEAYAPSRIVPWAPGAKYAVTAMCRLPAMRCGSHKL